MEIELLIKNKSEIKKAEKKILKLAEEIGILENRARGKLIEYLYRYNPKHHQALQIAGIIIK